MNYLNEIITIISLLAAVLAWIAKLKWSKEYSQAKDEIIRSKDAQIELLKMHIENLKDLNPIKLKEYYETVKEELEKYNDLLKEQLELAKKELEQKQLAINNLLSKEEENKEKIGILAKEKQKLEIHVNKLEENILKIETEVVDNENDKEIFGDIDTRRIQGLILSSNEIGVQLQDFPGKQEMKVLSESIKEKLDLIKFYSNQIHSDKTNPIL